MKRGKGLGEKFQKIIKLDATVAYLNQERSLVIILIPWIVKWIRKKCLSEAHEPYMMNPSLSAIGLSQR